MRLLEVVSGPQSDALVAAWPICRSRHGQERGARQGYAGFLANRVGTYWLQAAINAASSGRQRGRRRCHRGSRWVPKTGISAWRIWWGSA
jgi:hypothetical protein